MHHFPDLLGRLVSTNLFYFKSSWDDVRAAAPMFTGKQAFSLPCTLDLPYTPSQLEGANEHCASTDLPAAFLVVGLLLPARWMARCSSGVSFKKLMGSPNVPLLHTLTTSYVALQIVS